MKPSVVHLLPRPVSTGNKKRVHRRQIGEAVVGENGEPRLRLDQAHGVGDQEGVEFGVEPPCDREHAVRSGKVDDLDILENIDTKPEGGHEAPPADAYLTKLRLPR
jgi:hypothetical protein